MKIEIGANQTLILGFECAGFKYIKSGVPQY